MAKIDLSCDACHTKCLDGEEFGLVWVCPTCAKKIADEAMPAIPAGCVSRLYFVFYLYQTGRLSEGCKALCVK